MEGLGDVTMPYAAKISYETPPPTSGWELQPPGLFPAPGPHAFNRPPPSYGSGTEQAFYRSRNYPASEAEPSAAPSTFVTIPLSSVEAASGVQRSIPLSVRTLQGLRDMFPSAGDSLQDSSDEEIVLGLANVVSWLTRRMGEFFTVPPSSLDATTRQRLADSLSAPAVSQQVTTELYVRGVVSTISSPGSEHAAPYCGPPPPTSGYGWSP